MVRVDRAYARVNGLCLRYRYGGAEPQNLFLAVAASVAVAEARDNIGAQAVGIVVFVVVGSIGVAAPTVATQLAGDRAGATLARVDEVITRYNAVIVGAVLIILGAVVTTNGIDALLAS